MISKAKWVYVKARHAQEITRLHSSNKYKDVALIVKQRQAEGIAAAKAKGKKFGRPAMKTPGNWDQVYGSWKRGEITARKAIEMLGMKTLSFYKLVRIVKHRQKNHSSL